MLEVKILHVQAASSLSGLSTVKVDTYLRVPKI
jgi:hypothetical protein